MVMFLKELQTEIYAEHIRFVNAGIGQQIVCPNICKLSDRHKK